LKISWRRFKPSGLQLLQGFLLDSFSGFIFISTQTVTGNKSGLEWQLGAREPQRLARNGFRHPYHFK
jgi:hypothetical protein